MTDTAQPEAAAETDVVSREDALAGAAEAFKVHLGQEPQDERRRDEKGRFAAPDADDQDDEEIDAQAEAQPGEEGAESRELDEELDEAADEAQPDALSLPNSWPAEHAEMWRSLPPEAQAVIARREGERDAAVNAKFQEAANVARAGEAIAAEADVNRSRYAEAIEQVLALIQPQWPSHAMLDVNSSDYDPDSYHLMRAQAEQQHGLIEHLYGQREALAAQAMADAEAAELHRFQAINGASRDAFARECPDVTDQAKAAPLLQGLMDYAIRLGAPLDTFHTPTTALEWHVLWKAREYDRLQDAKGRVQTGPRPEPRKPQPAVRPGVTTPRSAIEASRRKGAMERLKQSGSIEDGAAVLKHLLKGNLG